MTILAEHGQGDDIWVWSVQVRNVGEHAVPAGTWRFLVTLRVAVEGPDGEGRFVLIRPTTPAWEARCRSLLASLGEPQPEFRGKSGPGEWAVRRLRCQSDDPHAEAVGAAPSARYEGEMWPEGSTHYALRSGKYRADEHEGQRWQILERWNPAEPPEWLYVDEEHEANVMVRIRESLPPGAQEVRRGSRARLPAGAWSIERKMKRHLN